MAKTSGYIVIIEWDGNIPPTPYYHRLRAITGGVRGNKEISVIARRGGKPEGDEMKGLILQEGAIVTPSESLARTIAYTAHRYGAGHVHVGEVSLEPFGDITQEDQASMARVNEAFGKRGRPSKPTNWIVSCHEDMKSSFVSDKSYVANCPRCGGFNISTYPSKNPLRFIYTIENGGEKSLINEWKVTRFGTGKFIIPFGTGDGDVMEAKTLNDMIRKGVQFTVKDIKKNVNTVKIKDEASVDVVDMICASDLASSMDAIDDVDSLISESILCVLDGLFVSFRHKTEEVRSQARIKAAMSIMQMGYTGYIRMSEDKDDLDVLDASSVFTPNAMRDMYYTTIDV